MLVSITFTLSAALLSCAQATVNNTQLDVEAIEAHFTNAGIVPSLLKQFFPSALLTVTYDGVGQTQPGQNLTVDQVKPFPELSVTPANASVSLSGDYTLAMVDADVVGTDETKGQTRHWLVNNVTISGSNVVLDHAVNITDYASPLPAEGSGVHRYVIILYAQPSSFSPTGQLAQPGQQVGTFDLDQYVTSSGLGPIVAATYYDVEQGTASAPASATSAVITSTLPAATGTASGSVSSLTPQPTASGKNSASGLRNFDVGFAGLLVMVGVAFAV